MLRALSRTLPLLQWTWRLAVLAALAFAWNAYGDADSRSGTGGSYAADLQQALSGLKEIARVLQ
jgi:hypothetical protein